jgi:hypothetical protein
VVCGASTQRSAWGPRGRFIDSHQASDTCLSSLPCDLMFLLRVGALPGGMVEYDPVEDLFFWDLLPTPPVPAVPELARATVDR